MNYIPKGQWDWSVPEQVAVSSEYLEIEDKGWNKTQRNDWVSLLLDLNLIVTSPQNIYLFYMFIFPELLWQKSSMVPWTSKQIICTHLGENTLQYMTF